MPDLIDLQIALFAVVAYLIGSISGSLVLGRLRDIDIRTMGSGNAGGTNALRSVGWPFALGVVLIDLGKGVVSAWLLPMLAPSLASLFGTPAPDTLTLACVCGFAAVLGHVWPVYFGFRGGKGAGTAVGAVLIIAPWCVLPLLVVWLIALLGTGYVGLATILAGLSLVPSMYLAGPEPLPTVLGVLSIALAVLLLFTHRSNLARLASGTENRFEKARVLKRRK